MLPAFALLIAAAAARDLAVPAGVLQSAPMVKLGQWSFALYLVHGLVILAVAARVQDATLLTAAIAGVLILVVSVGLSGALYEWVERPLERRIRGWSRQREPIIARL